VEGALICHRHIFASCDTVEGLSGKSISFIACGGFHTAAITDRGALYTWGGGYFGQLGQGDEADKKMPRRCPPALLRAEP
jgi:alpha-tubulin suppressor-like RCC1 family protein